MLANSQVQEPTGDYDSTLAQNALRLGYERQLAVAKNERVEDYVDYFQTAMETLSTQIHPNVYSDLIQHLRCAHISRFVHRLDDALRSDRHLNNLYRLGRMLGRACRMARDFPNAIPTERSTINYRSLRKCVRFVIEIAIQRTTALTRIVDAAESDCADAELPEMIAQEIPGGYRQRFSRTELPFHALYMLTSAALSSMNSTPHVDELSPGPFPFGPLTGTLKILAGSIGMKSEVTLKNRSGDAYELKRCEGRGRNEIRFRDGNKFVLASRQLEKLKRGESA